MVVVVVVLLLLPLLLLLTRMQVWSARHVTSGEEVAIKIIPLTAVVETRNGEGELEIMRSIEKFSRGGTHPSTVQLLGIVETAAVLYIIMEKLEGGQLFSRITQLGSYDERQAATTVRLLAEALSELHEHGIVHRDLKPDNILLRSVDSHTDVVIADFGLSAAASMRGRELKSLCGTPLYVYIRISAVNSSSEPLPLIPSDNPSSGTWRLRSGRASPTVPRWTCGGWG